MTSVVAKPSAGWRSPRAACWILLALCFLALVPVQRGIDREKGSLARFAEAVSVPPGEVLRRLTLGYEGLLADIYWTRAVQYFGRQRLARSSRFELLGPLLRVTTTLDPHLIVAYRYGAVFLAEKPPGGAGHPKMNRMGMMVDVSHISDQAVRDAVETSRAPVIASHSSSKAIAAIPRNMPDDVIKAVAAKGGELETSRLLWAEIYRHAENDQLRQAALDHLAALEAAEQIKTLDNLLARFLVSQGHPAGSFQDVVKSGLLRAAPRDPSGAPYVIGAGGRAGLASSSKVDLRVLQ